MKFKSRIMIFVSSACIILGFVAGAMVAEVLLKIGLKSWVK